MVQVGRDLLVSLCADLRLLWTEAGGPSLRVLERQLSLSKSQVGAILNAYAGAGHGYVSAGHARDHTPRPACPAAG